jgi:hypothetical protein
MPRSGVSNAIAAGLLVVGILIGAFGFYVATTYPTKTVTQTETATTSLTSTATVTVPTTATQTVLATTTATSIAQITIVSVSTETSITTLTENPADALDGQPVSARDMTTLQQASLASYGAPSQGYLSGVHNLTGFPVFTKGGNPILVYVGAEYCPYCAVQRWSLIMALMRFGNFTGLEYMSSALNDGDYSTFTFSNSTYQSSYLAFQPYEIYTRNGTPLQALPTNYTSGFAQYGVSSFPFLNFADEYYISGSILDPAILGTMNQSQIIASILAGNTVGSEIRQAANVITAVICETTGNKPSIVCGQPSITVLTGTLVPYGSQSTSSGSLLALPDNALARRRMQSSCIALHCV